MSSPMQTKQMVNTQLTLPKYQIMDFDLVKLVSTIEPKLPRIEAFVLSSTPRPSPSNGAIATCDCKIGHVPPHAKHVLSTSD